MSGRWPTVPALVAFASQRYARREALVDGDLRMTFAELGQQVRRSAAAAAAAGLEPGDRAAVWAPNIHEWVVAALGVLCSGGVVVPLNTRFKGPEAADILRRSRARLLFTVTDFLGTDYVEVIAPHRRELESLDTVVSLRGPAARATSSWSEYLAGAERLPESVAQARAAAVRGEHLSDIIFTSGTTGAPKGVMTTHSQTMRVYESWSSLVGLAEGDRYLVVNPFFHTFGYKAGFLAALMRGATTIPHAVFDVDAVLARVAGERVSMLPGPPTLYQSILDHPHRHDHDLSSLRLAVTGAAVVPVEMIERMRSELTFRTIITAYGLTECTGTATACRPEDDAETIATTSGRAIPDTQVRVVDDQGREVAVGQPGEVVVRGYNVMKGYLDDPGETAKAIDPDGWLHTGDVGVLDDRGYLRITDRLKDMFIVGGFNAYPAEIEGVLLRHPSVAQVAVVGMPDERLGEVGAAFVVARPGDDLDPGTIVAWAREHMANFKVPRRVEIVDSLPLNASGKVLKFELRERARAAG